MKEEQAKAEELIEKFYTEIISCGFEGVIESYDMAKCSAILCVDEILKVLHAGDDVTRAKYEAIRAILEQS